MRARPQSVTPARAVFPPPSRGECQELKYTELVFGERGGGDSRMTEGQALETEADKQEKEA